MCSAYFGWPCEKLYLGFTAGSITWSYGTDLMKVNQPLTKVQGNVKEKSTSQCLGRWCPGGTFWKSLGTTWKQLGDFYTAGPEEGSLCNRSQRLWRTLLNSSFFSNVYLQVMYSWVFSFRASNILCLIFHNSVILPLDCRDGLWGLTSCLFVASHLWKSVSIVL